MKHILILFILSFTLLNANAQSKKVVEAIQQENVTQSNQITALQDKVSTLESKVAFLQEQLDALKSLLNQGYYNNSTQTSTPTYSNPSQSSYTTPTYNSVRSAPAPSHQSQSTGQCQAQTKKGTRCSRAARSGGYCWQHGG